MSVQKFQVAYSARLQVERLDSREKAQLSALFDGDGPGDPEDTRPMPGGEFISRLGARRKVLWRRTQSGPEILSVVDRSYAA